MVRRIARSIFGGLTLAIAFTLVPPTEAATQPATQDVHRETGAWKQLMGLYGELVGVFHAASTEARTSSAFATTTPTQITPIPVPPSSGPHDVGMMVDPNGLR